MRKEQTSGWALDTYRRFGEAVQAARKVKGWTAQQLSDRTTELGYPISRSAIANTESGRKKALDLTEVLILAKALDVSPLELIYPGLLDAEVEVTPGVVVRSSDAALAFAGAQDYNPLFDIAVTEQDLKVVDDPNGYKRIASARRDAKRRGWVVNDGEA